MLVQDALGVDAFNVSSEALVAESLFDAYRAADEAAIRKLVASKPVFIQLDNQVIQQPSATAVPCLVCLVVMQTRLQCLQRFTSLLAIICQK